MCFLRSPHPHARIARHRRGRRGQDAGRPCHRDRAGPGTRRRQAAADVARLQARRSARRPRRRRDTRSPSTPFALSAKRVAAVVAATREQAREALDAIDVRLRDAADGCRCRSQAVEPGSPLVWPAATQNIAAEARHGDVAAAAKAFQNAAHVVALDLVNQRLAPCPIEPRAVLASYDAASDRITLRVSSQTPTGLRDTLCDEVLGIAREKVRVLVGDVGGGFGMKTGMYPEDVVLAFCARELKQPVKWCAERIEEFLAAIPRPRPDQQGRAGAGRVRPGPGAARVVARQPRRVRDARRRRDSVADRSMGLDEHLRHSAHRHPHQGACSRTPARRAPTVAPAGPRRSTSSSG